MVEIVSSRAVSVPAEVRLRRATAGAGLLSAACLAAAVLVANSQDVSTQGALQSYLQRNGDHLAIAWLIGVVGGLAWLVFVVGVRGLLAAGVARDLFVVAAVGAQAMAWAGASIGAATAPLEARDVTVAVYYAFREAGHLAGAAGTAAAGLALLGLAAAAARTTGWSPLFRRVTTAVGVVLALGAVIGPVTIPVLVLWQLGTGILLLRTRNRTPAGSLVRA